MGRYSHLIICVLTPNDWFEADGAGPMASRLRPTARARRARLRLVPVLGKHGPRA